MEQEDEGVFDVGGQSSTEPGLLGRVPQEAAASVQYKGRAFSVGSSVLEPARPTSSPRGIGCPRCATDATFTDQFNADAVRLVLDKARPSGRCANLDLTETVPREWVNRARRVADVAHSASALHRL